MLSKDIDRKPSETALMGALHRTIANRECGFQRFGTDHLAEYFLPSHIRFLMKYRKVRSRVKGKFDTVLPGLHEYIIARTAFFDSVFIEALRNHIPQIVLLGAGYDSRAYRFASLNISTRIIELDAAPTQNRKKLCLKKAQICIPKYITFAAINFNKESLINVLEKAGYDRGKKTLFLWEGVIYYLDSESVDATLDFVSQSSHRESTIALDYISSISDKTMAGYGSKEFFQAMNKHHANEELIFGIDEGEAGSFFEHRGLKMIDHWDNEEIERTFALNEDGISLGKITGPFRFAQASPKHKYS